MKHEELFHRWIEAAEKDQNWDIEQTRARSAPAANGIPGYSTILPTAKELATTPSPQILLQGLFGHCVSNGVRFVYYTKSFLNLLSFTNTLTV